MSDLFNHILNRTFFEIKWNSRGSQQPFLIKFMTTVVPTAETSRGGSKVKAIFVFTPSLEVFIRFVGSYVYSTNCLIITVIGKYSIFQ